MERMAHHKLTDGEKSKETGHFRLPATKSSESKKKRWEVRIPHRFYLRYFLCLTTDEIKLHLLNGNGSCGAYLDAALTAQAFVHVDRLGFTVFHLEYAYRAGIHALSLTVTFPLVH